MDRQDRKAAIAAYKERKPAWGVFAVICTATGETWVGRSRHVDTERNGLWFMLKLGASVHPALQAAWRPRGGCMASRRSGSKSWSACARTFQSSAAWTSSSGARPSGATGCGPRRSDRGSGA